jgi:hypothetical protein
VEKETTRNTKARCLAEDRQTSANLKYPPEIIFDPNLNTGGGIFLMAVRRRDRTENNGRTQDELAQPNRWEHGFGGVSGSTISSTVLIGAAVALLEPELLVGMGIGLAAVALPRVLPFLGDAVRPVLRSAVRIGYTTAAKTREVAEEAGEQLQDALAEAKSEIDEVVAEAKSDISDSESTEAEHPTKRAPQPAQRTRRGASRRSRAS